MMACIYGSYIFMPGIADPPILKTKETEISRGGPLGLTRTSKKFQPNRPSGLGATDTFAANLTKRSHPEYQGGLGAKNVIK